MAILQETEDRIVNKLRNLAGLIHPIANTRSISEQQRKVFVLLAQTTFKTSHHVIFAAHSAHELADEVNINYLAWAVRSLYEARIWVRFCRTEENALRFAADGTIDATDTLDAFMRMADHLPSANVDQMKDSRKAAGKFRGTIPYSDKELRLRVVDVAVELGLEDEHASMYKFLSKMLHVTSLSALWVDESRIGELFLPLINYAEACLDDIILCLAEVPGTT